MEAQRKVTLFLLLVTLSSVMGMDSTFSKEAYEAALNTKINQGAILKDAAGIHFVNLENVEEFVVAPAKKNEGVLIVPKNPKTVKAGILGLENQGSKPGLLTHVSIAFTKTSYKPSEKSVLKSTITYEDPIETTFGNLKICFEDIREKLKVKMEMQTPHESCLTALIFSSPQTPEDKDYAQQIAEEVDPFTGDQIQSISNGKPIKWALSSLNQVLSSGIKAIQLQNDKKESSSSNGEEQSQFVLKPIIVNEQLLKKYFELAN